MIDDGRFRNRFAHGWGIDETLAPKRLTPSPPADAAVPSAASAALSVAAAPEVRQILLTSAWVAGFQHHHGMHPKVLWTLEPGAPISLARESGNPYDSWAVALYTSKGARLGYLPRATNQTIAMMLDQGLVLNAAIESVDPEAETWKRVRVAIWIELWKRSDSSVN